MYFFGRITKKEAMNIVQSGTQVSTQSPASMNEFFKVSHMALKSV